MVGEGALEKVQRPGERWRPGFRLGLQKRVRQTAWLAGIDRLLRMGDTGAAGTRDSASGSSEGSYGRPPSSSGKHRRKPWLIATFLSWKRGCLVQNAVGVPSFFFWTASRQ